MLSIEHKQETHDEFQPPPRSEWPYCH